MNAESARTIIFDGIDPVTGRPREEPISSIVAGRNILRRKLEEPPTLEEKGPAAPAAWPSFSLPSRVHWGLVCRQDLDPDILNSLKPLLEHRNPDWQEHIYYHDGELDFLTWESHLEKRHGLSFRSSRTYYLLIVGSPKEIPYDFEKMLTPQFIVGRLHLPSADHYDRYVQSLLANEKDGASTRIRRRCVDFFAPDDTGATRESCDKLAVPLIESMKATGFETLACLRDDASRDGVLARLGTYRADGAPALTFLASHGAEVKDDLQAQFQGSWIPQGAAMLGRDPLAEDARQSYLTGHDFASGDLSPHGSVVFNFACFGAGMHREFSLREWIMADEVTPDAPNPLVSALAQSLLGNPRPALAYVGTLDRNINVFSLMSSGYELFETCFQDILDGFRVGEVTHAFWNRSATLRQSAEELLEQAIQRGLTPQTMSDEDCDRLALAWWLAEVLDNLVILGDPMVGLYAP